jgi:hypothetical protein
MPHLLQSRRSLSRLSSKACRTSYPGGTAVSDTHIWFHNIELAELEELRDANERFLKQLADAREDRDKAVDTAGRPAFREIPLALSTMADGGWVWRFGAVLSRCARLRTEKSQRTVQPSSSLAARTKYKYM